MTTTRVEAARTILQREILAQRLAWQSLESREHPALVPPQDAEPGRGRAARAACAANDFYPSWADFGLRRPYQTQTRIVSNTARTGACPFWIPPHVRGSAARAHEYRGAVRTPAELRPFSDSLTGELRDLALAARSDNWPVSQLVRVLTENGELYAADSVLRECRVDEGWCVLLRLFVAHLNDDRLRADSLASLLIRFSTPETGQDLIDPAALLPPQSAIALQSFPVPRKDSVIRHIWWLATPFFGDSANTRLSAHLARSVRSALARQTAQDAHHHTGFRVGGDAIHVMRLRYGWPDHNAWVGQAEEDRTAKMGITPPPPYSAPEYRWPRSSTLPSLRSAIDPLSVDGSDFHLVPPDSVPWWRWWPFEFFKHPDGHILPFGSEQRVPLRRDSSTRLLIATDLHDVRFGEVLDTIPDLPVRGELWFSPGPDSMALLHSVATRAGGRLALAGDVSGPGVMSAEYRVNAHGLAGGRSRFGIAALETLRDLPAGTCALSPPMVLDAASLAADGSTSASAIEAALLGSLTLPDPTSLGLAWESYGFAPGDTVTITVAVDRTSEISRLRRVGMVLGVAEDPSVSVAIQWTEPAAGRGHETIAASIPVLLRHLTLGVGTLKEGDYRLQVTMESAACGTVQQEQSVRITR